MQRPLSESSEMSHLPSFNELEAQIRRIYSKPPAEDCAKQATMAHAPASGNAVEKPEQQKFCIVQTKANLVKELEAVRDQVMRSQ